MDMKMEKNKLQQLEPTIIAGIDLKRLDRELQETTQNDCDRDPADVATDALAVIAELLESRDTANLAVPAKAGITSASPAGGALQPLEVYAGAVSHHGVPVHLILLPGDVRVTGLEVAEEFIASMNGELPTYAELAHLRRSMHHRFKPELYYTCDQEPYDGDMATVMFDFATDADRRAVKGPRTVRARAVRRVPVQREALTIGLTEQQVAAIAEQLIDDMSPGDDSDTTDDEKIAGAGIKVGIGKMAMAVQQALAAEKRQKGALQDE
jgi:hypothetical protein